MNFYSPSLEVILITQESHSEGAIKKDSPDQEEI